MTQGPGLLFGAAMLLLAAGGPAVAAGSRSGAKPVGLPPDIQAMIDQRVRDALRAADAARRDALRAADAARKAAGRGGPTRGRDGAPGRSVDSVAVRGKPGKDGEPGRGRDGDDGEDGDRGDRGEPDRRGRGDD